MSKIPLRDYNHEIEGLINNGKTDEAITHCKYLLKSFPKSVDIYRLLGKAYLEAQRYSEATDILTRILSVIPDDFVSQIGISIIREDEGNLDAAIYHMERAFEVKPSNSTIQEELRRLYGKRDGVIPPRVRLTRGALVRMYSRGELYPQAIAEIRAALAEDPKRVDLEVILARIYVTMGRKTEAIEVCSRLVNKLPNCLDANKILAEVLPGTSRSEDAVGYRQRVIALDPYAAYITKSSPTSNEVPDNTIMVEFFDVQSSPQEGDQPEWARSVGVDLQKPEETVPEWLANKPAPQTSPMVEPAAPVIIPPIIPLQQNQEDFSTPPPVRSDPARTAPLVSTEDEELIPDWMRSAGWSEASSRRSEPKETAPLFEEPSEEIAPAQLPEWLRDIAPADETETSSTTGRQEDLDRLDHILSSQQEGSTNLEELPVSQQSLTEDEKPVVPIEEVIPPVELPAWLDEQASPQTPAPDMAPASQEEIPDWLASLSIPSDSSQLTPETSPTEDLPDWLKAFTSDTHSETDIEPAEESTPDWLRDLQTETGSSLSEKPEEVPAQPEEPTPGVPVSQAEVADGLPPEETSEEPAAKTQPLVIMNVNHSVEQKPSEEPVSSAISKPEGLDNTDLEWLESFTSNEDIAEVPQPSAAFATVEPVDTEAIMPETPGEIPPDQETISETASSNPEINAPEEMDLDSAFAWLESLAASPGNDTGSTSLPVLESPDQNLAGAQQIGAEKTAPLDEPESEKAGVISSLEEMAQPEQPPAESISSIEELSQRGNLESELPGSDQVENNLVQQTSVVDETLPEWLRDLGTASADSSPVTPPASEESVSTWLKNINPLEEGTAISTEQPVEEINNETLPEWLPEAELLIPEVNKIPAEEGLPEWLQGIDIPTGPDESPNLEEPFSLELESNTGALAEQIIEMTPAEESPVAEAVQSDVELPEEIIPTETVESEFAATEWIPVDQVPEIKPEEEPAIPEESPASSASQRETPEIAEEIPVEKVDEITHPIVSSTPEETQAEGIPVVAAPEISVLLAEAHSDLDSGNLDQALPKYTKLIELDTNLEEIIEDLQNALYRFPVDIALHEALGDAYAQAERLQDALDTYTKAEELLLK